MEASESLQTIANLALAHVHLSKLSPLEELEEMVVSPSVLHERSVQSHVEPKQKLSEENSKGPSIAGHDALAAACSQLAGRP